MHKTLPRVVEETKEPSETLLGNCREPLAKDQCVYCKEKGQRGCLKKRGPLVTKAFYLFMAKSKGIANGGLTQKLGPWKRLVAHLS